MKVHFWKILSVTLTSDPWPWKPNQFLAQLSWVFKLRFGTNPFSGSVGIKFTIFLLLLLADFNLWPSDFSMLWVLRGPSNEQLWSDSLKYLHLIHSHNSWKKRFKDKTHRQKDAHGQSNCLMPLLPISGRGIIKLQLKRYHYKSF